MAKGNSKSQRDFSNSNPYNQSLAQLLTPIYRPPIRLLPISSTLTTADVLASGDRRLFQPDETTRPPHTARPGASRVQARPYPYTMNTLGFQEPKMVAICVRRKQRREVIFAKRKHKKGSGGAKHRNFWSAISC